MSFIYNKFVNVDYRIHILASLIIRFILIGYGIYHDGVSNVKYTDVDYKVFTDASRHVYHHRSPYNRTTYRYSPLIALMLIPNIILHHSFGKILFSLVDIFVALLIRFIVKNALKEYRCYLQKYNKTADNSITSKKVLNSKNWKKKQSNKQPMNFIKNQMSSKSEMDLIADISMMSWLYNPLTIAIATRGNSDGIAGFLVLLTLYFLQCKRMYFVTGLIHGISIHFRLYPIIYSLTLFMFLSSFSSYTVGNRRKYKTAITAGDNSRVKQLKNTENTIIQNTGDGNNIIPYNGQKERKTIFKKEYLYYLLPNFDQIKLILGCLMSLSFTTGIFYYLYGYQFLYETYIYHFIRKDTRHNFSLFFYLQYLTAWVKNIGNCQKLLIVLPQLILLLVFSVRYGLNKLSLNFSILTQTIVFVIYNGVLTSQYFVWIMAILPLCLWQIKLPTKTALFLVTIWFLAQAAWLLPAYLLEFQGQNTFLFIWIQSVSFFCANIAILGRLIIYYMRFKEKSL